jgi:hypothetical protein
MQRLETVTVKDISRIVMRNTFLHMLTIRHIRRKTKANLPKMVKRIRGTEGLSCPCSSTPVTWQA